MFVYGKRYLDGYFLCMMLCFSGLLRVKSQLPVCGPAVGGLDAGCPDFPLFLMLLRSFAGVEMSEGNPGSLWCVCTRAMCVRRELSGWCLRLFLSCRFRALGVHECSPVSLLLHPSFKGGPHDGYAVGIGRISGKVVQFPGVGLQVIELDGRTGYETVGKLSGLRIFRSGLKP